MGQGWGLHVKQMSLLQESKLGGIYIVEGRHPFSVFFTPVAVCSLCPGAALSSLAAAGIINLVEGLTESCLASAMRFKSLWGVVE